MKKIKIVMADQDENYLLPLEKKFTDELKETADIMTITSKTYFNDFFREGKIIDILVVSEDLFRQNLFMHDIKDICILTEDKGKCLGSEQTDCCYIEKYTSVKEIYSQVINRKAIVQLDSKQMGEKSTKIISVYSPIGGCGKTTVAAGIALQLSRYNRKALYMGLDNLQAFGYLMEEERFLQLAMEKMIKKGMIDSGFKQCIYHGKLNVIPPFSRQLCSLNIAGQELVNLAQTIQKWNDYDYIIVDLPSDISEMTTRFMSISEYSTILTMQDTISAYKMEQLVKNINCSDQETFLAVCNKYEADKENGLLHNQKLADLNIRKYIPLIPELTSNYIGKLEENDELHSLACMFL